MLCFAGLLTTCWEEGYMRQVDSKQYQTHLNQSSPENDSRKKASKGFHRHRKLISRMRKRQPAQSKGVITHARYKEIQYRNHGMQKTRRRGRANCHQEAGQRSLVRNKDWKDNSKQAKTAGLRKTRRYMNYEGANRKERVMRQTNRQERMVV